jgi:hypothetical protein
MAAGNDWPRQKRTNTEKERLLGMWLRIQRMKYRRNELDQDNEAQLNMLLPGWRNGRTAAARPDPQTSDADESRGPHRRRTADPQAAAHLADVVLEAS